MTSALPIALATLLALVATGAIYTGVAFINAELLPSALSGVYARTGVFGRQLIMLLVLATPANFMIAGVYRLVDPAAAGTILVAALAVVLAAKTLLHGVDGLGLRAAAAACATTAALMWLAWELYRAGS